MSDSRQFIIPEGMVPTNISMPAENLCHYITDDELRRLGEMRKDLVIEVCLASGGIFAGSIVPAFVAFGHWQTNKLSGADLIALLLFVGSLTAFVLTGFQWFARQRNHTDLVAEIRARPKVAVRHVA